MAITETVPVGSAFTTTGSTAGWACVPDASAGSTCTLTLGTVLGNGGGGSVSFAVQVLDPVPSGITQLLNATSIADDGTNGPDTTPSDNSSNDTTPVTADVDLTLAKTDGGVTAAPGGVIVYALTYTNVGTQTATGTVITETVPANTSFAPGSSTAGWLCVPDNSAGSTCTLALGTVAGSGGTGNADFAVSADNPFPGGIDQVDNSASVADDGSNGPDATPVDNSTTDSTPIVRMPNLEATKDDALIVDADASLDVSAGDTLRYTVVVTVMGNSGTLNAAFTDTPDPNTALLVGSVTTSTGTVTTGNTAGDSAIGISLGNLVAGAVVTITLRRPGGLAAASRPTRADQSRPSDQ